MTEIRDCREKHWFWIDDAVIDQHVTALGAYGLALYVVLARHADDNGAGQVSVDDLDVFGMEWRHMCAHIPVLVARGLLRLCGHTHDVFRYTLLACTPTPEAES